MCGRKRYSAEYGVTASTCTQTKAGAGGENKQIKKSLVVGLPAVIAMARPTDLRLWWVQFAARKSRLLAVVLFANGVKN